MSGVAVKICGLTESRSLKAAIEHGAAYVGLNFFRRSPRFVSITQAAKLAALVPRDVTTVGLFVDPTDADLEQTLKHVALKVIQLHGKETPERVTAVKRLTSLPVMKVIGVSAEIGRAHV